MTERKLLSELLAIFADVGVNRIEPSDFRSLAAHIGSMNPTRIVHSQELSLDDDFVILAFATSTESSYVTLPRSSASFSDGPSVQSKRYVVVNETTTQARILLQDGDFFSDDTSTLVLEPSSAIMLISEGVMWHGIALGGAISTSGGQSSGVRVLRPGESTDIPIFSTGEAHTAMILASFATGTRVNTLEITLTDSGSTLDINVAQSEPLIEEISVSPARVGSDVCLHVELGLVPDLQSTFKFQTIRVL